MTDQPSKITRTLEPDVDQARQFLHDLDPKGVFTFQTFADRDELKIGSPGGRPFDPLAKVFHGTLEEHAPALIALNRQGAGVFVMVNEGDGVVHDGRHTCRTAQNVIRVRAHFVDLDGASLDPVLSAAQLPSIVVESSPGRWHAYWRIEGASTAEFGGYQAALAEKFNGDASVTDLPRVMRLPGFIHQKGEPFMTRVVDIAEGGSQ